MPTDQAAVTAESSGKATPLAKRIKRFAGVDGRSAPARRLKTIEAQLSAPLGGLAALSPTERAHVQSAAALSARLEAVRSGLANGDSGLTDEDLVRLINASARAMDRLERLAVARRKASAPAGPEALRSYLATKAATEAAA